MACETEPVSARRYKDTVMFSTCQVEAIRNMEIRDDDIWVLSHPRSGTTLTQEIVYLLKTNLDFETADSRQMDDRFPFLDLYRPHMKYFQGLQRIIDMESPRFIKSHLHCHVLPPLLFKSNCKKIYVYRNPKDVFVSCLMLGKYLKLYDPEYSTDNFIDFALSDSSYGSPWWRHVRDFWLQRDDPNLLVLQFEFMVKNLESAVNQIAKHLKVDVTDKQVQKIVDHCRFDKMKLRDSTNAKWQAEKEPCDDRFGGHIRSGVIGDWRNFLTDEGSRKIDAMVKDKLSDLDIPLDFGS